MEIRKILSISFFKSLCLNLHCFGIKGLKFPILVSKKCKVKIKGQIILKKFETAVVTFGFGGSDGVVENRYSYFSVAKNARIVFEGKAGFSSGTSVRVDEDELYIGKNFSTNKNCFLACSKGISIGDDVTLGWNVNIRDNDGHTIIYKDTETVSQSQPVKIGNHVWICSYSDILKGAAVADDSVVAYRSLVTKKFEDDCVLIGGAPAKILKSNIGWQY